jgi:hypothetical protein
MGIDGFLLKGRRHTAASAKARSGLGSGSALPPFNNPRFVLLWRKQILPSGYGFYDRRKRQMNRL